MPIGGLVQGLIGAGGASAAGNAAGNAGWTAYNNAITQKTSNEAIGAPYTMGGWAGQNALLQALGLGHLTPMNMELGTESYGNTRLDQSNQAQDRAAGLANFQASPGYNFRLQQGVNALDRSAASRGMLLSGAQNKAISDYGQNTASQEWGNYINQLAGLAGQGASTAGQEMGANTSAINAGNNALMTGLMGQASSYSNSANALANGIGSTINSLGSLASFGLGGGFGGLGGGQVGGYSTLSPSATMNAYASMPSSWTMPGFGQV